MILFSQLLFTISEQIQPLDAGELLKTINCAICRTIDGQTVDLGQTLNELIQLSADFFSNKLQRQDCIEFEKRITRTFEKAEAGPLLLICRFYETIICIRTGQNQPLESFPSSEMHWAIQIEIAARLMNKGCYKEALQILENRRLGVFDLAYFWQLRLSIVKGICNQAQANYKKSLKEITEQERIAAKFQCSFFKTSTLRRRLSLMNESEHYLESEILIKKFKKIQLQKIDTSLQTLFWQEQIRYQLAMGQTIQAKEILTLASKSSQLSSKWQSMPSFIEEKCEIDLLELTTNEAMKSIRELLWKSQIEGDIAGQTVVLLALARAQMQANQLFESQKNLEAALALAKFQKYRKTQVKILLHLGIVNKKQGQFAQAKVCFKTSEQLAIELGLAVSAGFAQLGFVTLSSHPQILSQLSTLLQNLGNCQPILTLAKLLDISSFAMIQIQAFPKSACIKMDALSYFESLTGKSQVDFWGDEGTLNVLNPLESRRIVLSQNSTKILNLLIAKGLKGANAETIYASLDPRFAYVPERHRARLSGELSRLRKSLQTAGFKLNWNSKFYSIEGGCPLTKVSLLKMADDDGKLAKLTPLQNKILHTIQESQEITTTQLRTKLGNVSRQALHPSLKGLLALNLVVLHARGRSSFYSG